ncbi:MAG: WD40 repeat domain-containing protein, partial [Promethearchaeota archaeon]
MQGKIVLRDISFVNTIFDPLLRRRLIFLAVLFLGVTWISALVPPMVFLSFSGSSHEKIDSNSPQLPPNDASAGLGNFKQQIQVNQLYPQFAERFNSIEEVTGHIIAVDFSPSGRFLAYAGRLAERDEVVLFDMVHWKSIWRRAQFPSEIYFTHDTFPQVMSVVFSPDERYIAAASYFYGIGIWEVMNGVKVSQLNDSAIFSDPDERVHDPSF